MNNDITREALERAETCDRCNGSGRIEIISDLPEGDDLPCLICRAAELRTAANELERGE